MKKITTLLSALVFTAFGWNANAQFTEDFEGTFLPANWSKDLGDLANDIIQTNSENHTPLGVNSARFSSYNSASDYNQYLFTHQFTVTAPNTELRFWHQKFVNNLETLEWGVSTTTDTSTAVSSWNAVTLAAGTWTEEVVDLSSFVGQTIYFAFHYYGNYQYYVYLDDVSLSIPPTCTAPTALMTANLLATSVELSWTSAATSWEIEYGTTGFTQGTGTAVVTGTNPHSLTGLNATTSYDFYVRAICGAGDTSTWVGPVNFVTPCIAPIISAFPYSENFDSETAPAIPCGWTRANDNGDANQWMSSTVIPNSGTNYSRKF